MYVRLRKALTKQGGERMRLEDIDAYIKLRQQMSEKDWNALDSLYNFQLENKKHELTKNVSLDSSDLRFLRSRALKLI